MKLLLSILLVVGVSAEAATSIEAACIRTSMLYAAYADSGDADAFAALFTDDGIWEASSGRYVGRAAIAEQMRKTFALKLRMRHVITNQLVTPDGATRARGSAYVTLYVAPDGVDDLTGQPVLVGEYKDAYVMRGDTCFFESRVSAVAFARPAPP
jgi:uncharacterized protein (TIGR02246 family)